MYDVKRAHSKRLTCCVQLSATVNTLRDGRGSEVREGDLREQERERGRGCVLHHYSFKTFFSGL